VPQEYADGNDLFSLLHRYGGRLSERVAVQLVLDPFMRVLHYLHTRGIVHRWVGGWGGGVRGTPAPACSLRARRHGPCQPAPSCLARPHSRCTC
jgi:hypothetical protein